MNPRFDELEPVPQLVTGGKSWLPSDLADVSYGGFGAGNRDSAEDLWSDARRALRSIDDASGVLRVHLWLCHYV